MGSMLNITFMLLFVSIGYITSQEETNVIKHTDLSRESTLVWGPGLCTDFVVPARYFYIQAVDINQQNFSESLGDIFEVKLSQQGGGPARVWVQTLDRKDGTYLVRFKPFSTYKDVHISIFHEGRHVAQSPYLLRGQVYHENCYCPEASLEKWYENMKCPDSYSQIESDLSVFNSVDMSKVVKEAVQRFNQAGTHSICHYAVVTNKVYRTCYGQHVGFKMFMDNILLSLTRKVLLPDFELIVNLGDWPLEKRAATNSPLPLFSWCGSTETSDIVMPTYDLTEASLECMGRVTLDMLSVQANTGPQWQNKTSKAFWRGRDSRQERLDLVTMSRQHPDKIDAALTNFFFFRDQEDVYGPKVKPVSFFDFFKAQEIAQNAQAYTRSNLMPADVFCYHVKLFQEWSKRVASKAKVAKGMDLVPQSSDSCDCDRQVNKQNKDEL
ncbi:PREDICTED: KDEL motif-containing protein 1-like isoform X2 [Priapulus caudatus]|uniref:KDEL motif-containing protein 1-like isoform X2 n=1 Tax=Priapulus caudatus TaxID=37621 RepID=A0ABM1EGB3_PRICU|nr:PREDICTED: KDEL motif-containing protein 1-like isoform X2 [Priapulus caudatus]